MNFKLEGMNVIGNRYIYTLLLPCGIYIEASFYSYLVENWTVDPATLVQFQLG